MSQQYVTEMLELLAKVLETVHLDKEERLS